MIFRKPSSKAFKHFAAVFRFLICKFFKLPRFARSQLKPFRIDDGLQRPFREQELTVKPPA